MTVHFNDIFKKETDWTKVKLLDDSPCATCEFRIDLRKLHPGNTWDSPSECTNCPKRLNHLMLCLQKLAWYEQQEKLAKKKLVKEDLDA